MIIIHLNWDCSQYLSLVVTFYVRSSLLVGFSFSFSLSIFKDHFQGSFSENQKVKVLSNFNMSWIPNKIHHRIQLSCQYLVSV
jgi:hypothetical protein